MDHSEIISLHLANFGIKYQLLQRKKLFFIQKYIESQTNINSNYMQIMEHYRKFKECLNLFQFECANPSQDIFLKRLVRRSVWKINRKSNFWEDKVPTFSDKKFKQVFRMKRKSFEILCEKLYFLKKVDTNKRKAISLEKRIAIALYALGSPCEYKAVANLFGVGRTTVGKIVSDFCTAVCNTLQEIYINSYPPSEEKIIEIVTGFQRLGFPQCFGAIDGCHIKISPQKEEFPYFYNSKGWYSVILFASADYRCRFTYINVDAPGRNSYSFAFENSDLKINHEMNAVFYENYKVLENTKIPILLIGDSALPLSEYVMTPYPSLQNQPAEEKIYNKILSKSRSVITTSFDQLKTRFRKIGNGLEVHYKNNSTIIKACCVLHNFLNEENDHFLSSWLKNFKESAQPDHIPIENKTEKGEAIRKAIATFLHRRGVENSDIDSGTGDGDNGNRSGAGDGDVESFTGGGDSTTWSGGDETACEDVDVDGNVGKSEKLHWSPS